MRHPTAARFGGAVSTITAPAEQKIVDEVPKQLYIGGVWRDGAKGTLSVEDPSTGESLCEVADASTDDAKAALAAAVEAGNRRLAEYVDRLRDLVLAKGTSTPGRSRTLHDICDEHEAILERVVARDAKAAAAAMKHHLTHTGRLLLKQEGGRGDDGALDWGDLVPF